MTKTIDRIALALALALSATPALAEESGWGIDLTVHGGMDRYDSVGLRSGLSSTDFSSSQQLDDASQTYGGTAIVRLGMLDLGAIGELGRAGKSNTTTVIGALGGLNFDLRPLRLEALAEVGGHRYGNALRNSAIIADSNRSDWLAYVGLRPGLSVSFGEDGRWLLGVWGFARWDVTRKNVQVTLQNGSGTGSYKLGGSQFGAALRFGISL
jgi:hypothetical protein